MCQQSGQQYVCDAYKAMKKVPGTGNMISIVWLPTSTENELQNIAKEKAREATQRDAVQQRQEQGMRSTTLRVAWSKRTTNTSLAEKFCRDPGLQSEELALGYRYEFGFHISGLEKVAFLQGWLLAPAPGCSLHRNSNSNWSSIPPYANQSASSCKPSDIPVDTDPPIDKRTDATGQKMAEGNLVEAYTNEPTPSLPGHPRMTYQSALDTDTNFVSEAVFSQATSQLCVLLWEQPLAVEGLVRHHLGLPGQDDTRIPSLVHSS
ncbi:hypothetical protein GQ53DRAFT_771064 [Thozetella sp. PMI_491]|nr:hypothetical protein GQ53DRAFT_771064 [Thozetella sp. PMI_491]